MSDLGPSLAKLRRDWKEAGDIEVPTGMISRRVLGAMVSKLAPGERLVVERIAERTIRVSRPS